MEKDAKYFIVGIFVSLTLAAMFAFTIWIAGSHDTRNYARYTVHFTDPVNGLKVGATVQYKGVEVGKVIDVRLAPERNDLIRVDIEVAEEAPIYAGTLASLAMMGITGMVYVDMITENADAKPAPNKPGEKYPVIQGNGTNLAKILQDIPEISKQVLEVSTKLNQFLDEGSMENLDLILANVEKLSRDMNGLLSAENVTNATLTMQNLSQSSGDLQGMIERFEQTADEIDKAVDSITGVVTRNEASINKFTGDGLNQITDMSRETRKMAISIRRTADKLNQDPSQIIYQPSSNGVEIPQ